MKPQEKTQETLLSSSAPPRIGCRMEIRDPRHIWASAIIVSISSSIPETEQGKTKTSQSISVTLRYDGWGSEWNEQLPLTSERLAPLYTNTARLWCLVELFQQKKKAAKNHAPKTNLWPCVLYIRMPCSHAHSKRVRSAEHDLSLEPNVFVEPYRPDLLPLYIQKDWKNGGFWLSTNRIHVLPEEMIQAEDLSIYCHIYPQGIQYALLQAKQDSSVCGFYRNDIFLRGSLVKPIYRAVCATDNQDATVTNPLVVLKYWKNESVNLEALDRISDRHLDDVQVRGKNKCKTLQSHEKTDGNTGSLRNMHKIRRLDLCSCPSDCISKGSHSQIREDGDDSMVRCRDSVDSHVSNQDCKVATVGKSTSSVTSGQSNNAESISEGRDSEEARNSMVSPHAIKLTDSIYLGYNINQSLASTGKWVASIMSRGNEVQIGQYETQSEAKQEIDKYYENMVRADKYETEAYPDNIVDSSDDEFDARIVNTRINCKSEPTFGRKGDNYSHFPPAEVDPKEEDVNAISIQDAVSFAYRQGYIEDTGFSFYDWAKVAISKDTDKIPNGCRASRRRNK